MAAAKRVFKFDKKTGRMVETTPPESRELCKQLRRKKSRSKVAFDNRIIHSKAKWPIHSEKMAVNPEDVARAQGILAQHGIQTEYDRAGRPILRCQSHRKAHAEALGFYDRNGGYGDPQAKNR